MSAADIEGLYRICVKVYASEDVIEDDAELFVPIFHEWIRDKVLDMVMLDVADYAHAPDSPGIMLVCHEVSFALDRSDGQLGLLAQRRTPIDGTAADAVSATIRHALHVGARLEADPRIRGKLKLDPSVLRIESNDRLLAPNTQDGFEAFAPIVLEGVGAAFGGAERDIERVDNDPRDRLTALVQLSPATSVEEQLAALTPILPQGSV